MASADQNQFLKGSLTAIILKLLETNGRMYGYEMTKAVRDITSGAVEIGEAALYPALHKLVSEGVLETESEMAEGRMRKYYSLSRKGKTEASARLAALKDALASLQLILNAGLQNG